MSKYVDADAPVLLPKVSGRPQRGRKVDAFTPVIDERLRREPRLCASVIHEGLVTKYGFDGHYQLVKLHVRRPARGCAAIRSPALGCIGVRGRRGRRSTGVREKPLERRA